MRLWISLLLLFLATRAFGVANFAPHTDEMVYTQYAQRIAEDWNANWDISMDGRMHGDFKEPLQYWLTSLTVERFRDPLLGARIWSVLMGLLGFVFTALIALRIFDRRTAVITAVLLLTSPYFLYFDAIALAEAYVYGLGAVFLYHVINFCERRSLWALVAAAIVLGFTLTAKQSGLVWIGVAAMIPFAVPSPSGRGLGRGNSLLGMYVSIAVTIAAAFLFRSFLVPGTFADIASPSRGERVRSLAEIPAFLLDGFSSNVRQGITSTLWSEFGIALPLIALILAGILVVLARERSATLRPILVMLAGFLLTFFAAAAMLRFPYVRFFGMGLGLLSVALAAAAVEAFRRVPARCKTAASALACAFLLWRAYAFVVPVAIWGQTDIAFAESSGSWPQGIGMREMLRRIEILPPGVLVYDPQWGHPGTAIEVYANHYPQLEILPGAEPVLAKLEEIRRVARERGRGLFLLYDRRLPGDRPVVDKLLENPVFCAEREVIFKEYKGRVLEDTALVLCTAG